MTSPSSDEHHTHSVAIYLKVCDEPTQHVADIEIEASEVGEATVHLANALRGLANVIDTKGTFEELVQGL